MARPANLVANHPFYQNRSLKEVRLHVVELTKDVMKQWETNGDALQEIFHLEKGAIFTDIWLQVIKPQTGSTAALEIFENGVKDQTIALALDTAGVSKVSTGIGNAQHLVEIKLNIPTHVDVEFNIIARAIQPDYDTGVYSK